MPIFEIIHDEETDEYDVYFKGKHHANFCSKEDAENELSRIESFYWEGYNDGMQNLKERYDSGEIVNAD